MATHGIFCSTRTFPTRCPSCNDNVFYFSCSCGSRVFFDSLGGAWPIHDCDTSWTRSLRRTTGRDGARHVELGPGVTLTRPGTGFDACLRTPPPAHRREAVDPFLRITPKSNADEFRLEGVLRELDRDASPFRALGIDPCSVGVALMGVLGQIPMAQITVHGFPDEDGIAESFTGWVAKSLASDPRIRCGIMVEAHFEAVQVGNRWCWFCDDFQVVG